jgi:hypothetical protein
MGELFNAYSSLNRTLKLGLSAEQIMRAEGSLKSAFARKSNPAVAAKGQKYVTENFEFKVSIRKRPRAITMAELSKLAQSRAKKL